MENNKEYKYLPLQHFFFLPYLECVDAGQGAPEPDEADLGEERVAGDHHGDEAQPRHGQRRHQRGEGGAEVDGYAGEEHLVT